MDYLIQFSYDDLYTSGSDKNITSVTLVLPIRRYTVFPCGEYSSEFEIGIVDGEWKDSIISLSEAPNVKESIYNFTVPSDMLEEKLIKIDLALAKPFFSSDGNRIISFRISSKNQCYLKGTQGGIQFCYDLEFQCSPSIIISSFFFHSTSNLQLNISYLRLPRRNIYQVNLICPFNSKKLILQ
eukprot:TRINITY_DN7686_c0_g1_i1.p1 TRINITY_DN7686_c0_g1~~TRINITY_DN7686_c0_g1_i1.p1  ORF type:complete len:183 (-),score=9.96 TRINITY_DN7686_c0_g1_i1:4-552(-)